MGKLATKGHSETHAMDAIFRDLTEAQREAVGHLDGPMLILAGPGSGKTRVVTHRIANMLNHGGRPWQIAALTFTNKAAEEMRTRVDSSPLDNRCGWDRFTDFVRSYSAAMQPW